MEDNLFVEGEILPRFGLVINGKHEPRIFYTIEEAESARVIHQRKRLDKRVEIYDGHLRKIVTIAKPQGN